MPADTNLRGHVYDDITQTIGHTPLIRLRRVVGESKATLVEAGDYIHISAKAPHWAKAKTECVFLRYSNGPVDITYLDEKKK